MQTARISIIVAEGQDNTGATTYRAIIGAELDDGCTHDGDRAIYCEARKTKREANNDARTARAVFVAAGVASSMELAR